MCREARAHACECGWRTCNAWVRLHPEQESEGFDEELPVDEGSSVPVALRRGWTGRKGREEGVRRGRWWLVRGGICMEVKGERLSARGWAAAAAGQQLTCSGCMRYMRGRCVEGMDV